MYILYSIKWYIPSNIWAIRLQIIFRKLIHLLIVSHNNNKNILFQSQNALNNEIKHRGIAFISSLYSITSLAFYIQHKKIRIMMRREHAQHKIWVSVETIKSNSQENVLIVWYMEVYPLYTMYVLYITWFKWQGIKWY